MAERGYGWEKLLSEMFCQEYWAERGMETSIARFHNVYGPHGTWDGGREKAPAALCRKVIEAVHEQQRPDRHLGRRHARPAASCYIDDCVDGIDRITHCDALIATPMNLGSSELVSINELVSKVEHIAGVKLDASTTWTRRRAWPAATATTPSSSRCSAGSRARRWTPVSPRRTRGSRRSTGRGTRKTKTAYSGVT